MQLGQGSDDEDDSLEQREAPKSITYPEMPVIDAFWYPT